ncbi:MAG TPA: aspartate kinase [Phycisphaerales bacterium]|nr:aspartate kinase [Phycisphaerales bacterium]
MIVHKFGGTSVGDADRFSNVADIVIKHHREALVGPPEESAVVVSAMSGVTKQLIDGARAAAEGQDSVYREIKAHLLSRHLDVVEALLDKSAERLEVGGLMEDRLHDLERLYRSIAVLGELTVRGRDVVTSFGEQLSAHILAAVLRERGVRAQAINATELMVTDDHFGSAAPLMGPTRERLEARVRPLIARGVIPVITGYIGATEEGVTSTLGRGGSDYSAAIIGAALEADEVWIWSDVDGILTADPNIVPQARTLDELSYAEAADLAYFGADVLHPKTIRPVLENGIPLRILNSFNPGHPGTLIVKAPGENRAVLPAIISTTGLSLIVIGSEDDSWTLPMAVQALQRLSEAGFDVLMLSQSLSEHNLNLVVREQDQAHCLKILRRAFDYDGLDSVCNLGVKEKVATISVLGVPGWNDTGVVSHAFLALGKCSTRVIAVAQAAAEHSVSFCIPEEQVADTALFLHRELVPIQ